MIIKNNKIKKSEDIFKAVDNELKKLKFDLDGTIEIFNDGKEQGSVLKLFNKYNSEIDMCIWVYLPTERDTNNQMEVIIGFHNDCNNKNLWNPNLPSKVFTQIKAIDLHREVRDYIMNAITSRLDKINETKINN